MPRAVSHRDALCPGSCVMDLVLRRLHGVLRRAKVGIIRACADDLASALRTARAAQLLAPEFRQAEHVAGLSARRCR